jgi:hypothetical protein
MQCSHHDDNQALATYERKRKGKITGFGKTFKGRKLAPTFEHKMKDMSKVQCFRCDKYGHYVKKFPTWKKGKKYASISNVDLEPPYRKSRNARMNDEEFLFISSLSSMVPTSNYVWLIDSGASIHMTRYREHLIYLVEKESCLHVVLGDDARYTMKGVGSTYLQLDSGTPLHLSDVLFVPGMRRNLVSILSLENKGYKVSFSDGKVLAWNKNSSMDSSQVIGVREDRLYILIVRPFQDLIHDSISLSELWHMRLAHLHYRDLPSLGKMVIGLPNIHVEHDGICIGCSLGNNAKGSFPSSDNRSKGILDLVHTVLCGPMIVSSLHGYLYYVIFIDDHSRKTWIYLLKINDGVLYRFHEYKEQVENLIGKKIKVLRSDNGG